MRKFVCGLNLLVLAMLPAWNSHAADAPWLVKDAPYRAVVTLIDAPKVPDCGVAIQLPEFGQTRPDLDDVLLVDAAGRMQPLASVWRGEGQTALLLARTLNPGETYSLYFGGGSIRSTEKWTPKLSLLMETRRLPANAKFDSWPDMQKTWTEANAVDGAGFVNSIYQGGNPFGESANFVTHYTGYLRTSGSGGLLLYTLSSDASFVLVDNRFEFAWPGLHSPRADATTVHSKKVECSPDFTRIDYYHAKVGGDQPATVLGWQVNGKFEAIPPDAWLHPGAARLGNIEEAHARPVPIADMTADSYIGYGERWFYDSRFTLPGGVPAGWDVTWQFDDGAIFSGTDCRRVVVGSGSHTLTVSLKRGNDEVRGVKRFHFPDYLREASINHPDQVAHYLDLLAQETPAKLSAGTLGADLVLLRDFATDGQIAKLAVPWLSTGPVPDDPLWLPAQLSRLRAMSQDNPKQALDELRRIDPIARQKYAQPFDTLELDILVFGLRDPSVSDLARRIAFENPNSEIQRLAAVRVGDFHRLTGHYPQAIAQYRTVQASIVDESAGRKLPAQDQAYSITIENLIARHRRREALETLQEWELSHPIAKFDSDFLLLRGRALNAFGRWNESLAELVSFENAQPDSPYVIDADFYRAQALDGLGKKDEARKIWNAIAKNYPNNSLAAQCKALAAKP
jgi:tetratricopeptide (TPR) repeat protein